MRRADTSTNPADARRRRTRCASCSPSERHRRHHADLLRTSWARALIEGRCGDGPLRRQLAHEIRNPLAAISYATQLLEESNDLKDADRRLLQIVHQQCLRTNGIVESVLGLARRERANPEHIDLVGFVRRFVDDYRETMPEENGSLKTGGRQNSLPALVDPRHLHQMLTALVHNAIHYGHLPGEAARIMLHVDELDGSPVIEVSDRGPGIPDAVTPTRRHPA